MAPKQLLDGKVALVTGGGSGYGEGIVRLFAEEGAKVLVADINAVGGQRVVDDLKAQDYHAELVHMDVTRRSDWDKALEVAKSTFGGLDVLVNNAGWTYRRKATLEVSDAEYDKVFDVNVRSIFHATNSIMPYFLEKKAGNIINISSCITENPTTGLTWYGASKGAVDMVTRHLAAEYSPLGIRVNSISPSIGNTALFKDFIANDKPDSETFSSLHPPLGRLCTPLDIAKGTLYLATEYFNDFQT
ncbi:hypothetical protein PV08_07257 [Exophiala spinifera]|uniref:Uncharacterized protein n=1 Tax=Exophiala spinifera TaxID=91928 RepID=A0A0D2B6I8_9EURO|nr:uncharacterized protein PV08_07257 [Exophiala spinifera]KIW14473.1 hypothetical protein PV08_07257 [Exophiala spinifera]